MAVLIPRSPRRRLRAAFPALVLAAAVALAGCGPASPDRPASSPSTTPDPVPTSASAAATTAAPTTPAPATTSPAARPGGTHGPRGSAAAHPAPAGTAGGCGPDRYRNVDGRCVPRPTSAPAAPPGASARCNDGTYSFSAHRRGTCSHHGGVAAWL